MKHIPVLKDEAIKLLNIKPDGVYLDLTLGRAGHASEILKHLTTGKLIAFDLDKDAIKESKPILDKISSRYEVIHSNYCFFDQYVKDKVDGILLDLGVSSPQFDDPSRGFSYQVDALLDMRMNVDAKLTAKQLLNTLPINELTKILREYGEEKDAFKITFNPNGGEWDLTEDVHELKGKYGEQLESSFFFLTIFRMKFMMLPVSV